MKKNLFLFLLFALSISISDALYSQSQRGLEPTEENIDQLLLENTVDETNFSYARFKTDTMPQSLNNSNAVLKKLLQMRNDDELRLSVLPEAEASFDKAKIAAEKPDIASDGIRYTNQRYEQYYKGIRVAYGNYSIFAKNDTLLSASGNFQSVGNVNVIPQITEKQALKSAMNHIGADRYAWLDSIAEAKAQEHWGISHYPNAELVIVKDELTGKGYRLAYLFDIYAIQPLSRNLIYIDAITGDILCVSNRISDCQNTTGTTAVLYSGGTKTITTDKYLYSPNNYKYRLREWRNGLLETYEVYQGVILGDFTDNDNNWTAAEHGDKIVGMSAHWAAERTIDYFYTKHYRYGWNGQGAKLVSEVETSFPGTDNASWDGAIVHFGYGNTKLNPLVSLDIVAHEIGHAVTESTAYLRYQGESGALDESISDIWGACVEYWVTGDTLKCWLIGDGVMKNKPDSRNMLNPKASGDIAQPNTYQGVNWANPNNLNYDRGGVHINSGVPNYWFYLLSQGGVGINDNGQSYSVGGIGIDKAAKIVYRTIRINLASVFEQSVSFSQFVINSINAAIALYGDNSVEVHNVKNAWYAVGLHTAPSYYGAYLEMYNNALCSPYYDEIGFSVENLPNNIPNNSIAWSCSSNIHLGEGNYGNYNWVMAKSGVTSGDAWVKVTICGLPSETRYFKIGAPPSLTNTNYNITIPIYNAYTAHPPKIQGIPGFVWSSPNLSYPNPNYCDSTIIFPTSVGSGYTLYAYPWNDCGVASSPAYTYNITVTTNPSYFAPPSSITGYTIYPNPAGSSLTVAIDTQERMAYYAALQQTGNIDFLTALEMTEGTTLETPKGTVFEIPEGAEGLNRFFAPLKMTETVYDIRLYDGYGNLLRQGASDGETITFNIAALPAGMYYLHIYDGISEQSAMQTILKE